jgi:hypothetical protein
VWFGEWTISRRGVELADFDSDRDSLLVPVVEFLSGHTIDRVAHDSEVRTTRWYLSDGVVLEIRPCTYHDDEAYWELYRNGKVVIEVGPHSTDDFAVD